MNEDYDIQPTNKKSNPDSTQLHTTVTDSTHHEQPRQPSQRSMYELVSLVTVYCTMFTKRLARDLFQSFLANFYSDRVLPDHVTDLLQVHKRLRLERGEDLITYSRYRLVRRAFDNQPVERPISMSQIYAAGNSHQKFAQMVIIDENNMALAIKDVLEGKYPPLRLRLSPSSSASEESLQLDPLPPILQLADDSVMRKAVDFLHSDNELILACELGKEDRVSELIRIGVNVNFRDAIGRTALHFAVQTDNIRIITMLLNAGADATRRDNVGLTPLSICLMRKPSVEVAKLLFDHGAVILPRVAPVDTGLFLQFAMMCTPTKEEVEILALLIEKGALINDPYVPGGRSALHFAAMSNNCNLIHTLRQLGANIFAVNHRGQTPLDVAVTFRCKQAIECLSQYMNL